MPLAEAIQAIQEELGGIIVSRPDVSTFGQQPTRSVFHSGSRVNIHGELAHFVTVDIHKPSTATFVSDEDILEVTTLAEHMLVWFANNPMIGRMLIWWESPPDVQYDYVPSTPNSSAEATAHIVVTLAERYPRA